VAGSIVCHRGHDKVTLPLTRCSKLERRLVCHVAEKVAGSIPKEPIMNRRRDDNPISQHGVNDPVSGVDVRWKIRDNKSPHECAQWAADVRAKASPDPSEEFLPEALRRSPTAPLNKRTGRRRAE
jgi:hypothetical protein